MIAEKAFCVQQLYGIILLFWVVEFIVWGVQFVAPAKV
jgi:hypothetical protein